MAVRRVIHVIVPRYALTDFLFGQMHGREDIRLIEHPMHRRGGLAAVLRGLEVYVLPWLRYSLHLDRAYIDRLASIEPEDAVLFFAIENRKDLQLSRKFVGSRRQSLWLWNPIRKFRGNAISRLWYRYWIRWSGMQAYTFDPTDASDNNFRLTDQVYRHPAGDGAAGAACAVPAQDVYFLGIDKGRLARLQSLESELAQAGLTTHFHVVADCRKRYSDAQRAWLASGWMPYDENLRRVGDSRALLELLQSTQSGPTMRSMEAAFLGRKLITNNRSLRDTPLYHPSRVFILGQDDTAELRHFIDQPMQPLDLAVLRHHDIEHWIRQFGD